MTSKRHRPLSEMMGTWKPHTTVFLGFLDSAEETCKDFPWSWDEWGWPGSLTHPRGTRGQVLETEVSPDVSHAEGFVPSPWCY